MAPKENLFLGLKGLCDCFHMVGQHGDKHGELRPRSIWLVPQHCPSTAVILYPNIWVIARYAWELSAPPILGIPCWQHASNSSPPPPASPIFAPPLPPDCNTITQQSFTQALGIPSLCGGNAEGDIDVLQRGSGARLGVQHIRDRC